MVVSEKLGLNLGKKAVEIARRVLDSHIGSGKVPEVKDYPREFKAKRGAFVTLNTYPEGELRGCIGYIEPIKPLIEAIVDNAVNASTHDPRFPRVRPKELDRIVVEVSILTPPEHIKVNKPKELLNEVVVGRDGLIAELPPFNKGVLLPQVPVDEGWEVETFLAHTCWKAGLNFDAWLNPKVRFYRFTAEVYKETRPRGDVVGVPLSPMNLGSSKKDK